jgi:hypothetical protein
MIKKQNYFYSARNGTTKKNIQTTTIYIFLCCMGSYRFKNILIYDLIQINEDEEDNL